MSSSFPAKAFTIHNFSNYTDSRFGSLLVTNDYGIVGGRDTEDDDSYRYRIHLKLVSQAGSNEAALRFALLQVPGIQDVLFDSKAGTFTCYIYAITPVAAASVIQAVQDTIDETVAFPVTGIAVNPDLVGISFATTISLIAGTTQTDRDTALSQATAAAQTYLNNLGVGNPLIINDIAAAIRNASAKILDVGQPKPLMLFICTITAKESRLPQGYRGDAETLRFRTPTGPNLQVLESTRRARRVDVASESRM